MYDQTFGLYPCRIFALGVVEVSKASPHDLRVSRAAHEHRLLIVNVENWSRTHLPAGGIVPLCADQQSINQD